MKTRKMGQNRELSRLLDVQDLQNYLSMGRNKAVAFARENGAEKRIGKRLLFDKQVLDRAIDSLGV